MQSIYKKHRILFIFLILIVVFVITFEVLLTIANNNIEKKDFSSIYNNPYKVWSSRGFYESHDEQNSIKSIKKAFELGAKGVEIDFYYDVKMDKFIVSHSKPKKRDDGTLEYTLKHGKLLTLEDVFKAVGKDKYFWLDYKNLDRISTEQTKKAIKRLQSISSMNNIKNRLYIEGSDPFMVSLYTDAGFYTILGIHPLRSSNFFSKVVLNGYKIGYGLFNISAIAMPSGKKDELIYTDKTKKILKNIPIFLFHIPNDDKLLSKLVNDPSIRVMLVGRDKNINRYDLTSSR